MVQILDTVNTDKILQVTFIPNGDKMERPFQFTVNKFTRSAIVEAPYIEFMNYGYSRIKNYYKVYEGNIDEIMKKYKTPNEFLNTF